jgi:phosphoribosylamine--glycine ligase
VVARAKRFERLEVQVDRMRVMVLGSGAREHALAWRLRQDEADVLVAPGNAGSGAAARSIALDPMDSAAVVRAARDESVDLVVVGPEAPLTAGIVDALEAAGIAAFGPNRAAAELEGSKVHSKRFMARHSIPTAAFEVFDDFGRARDYVRAAGRPLVIKADGLCAGKGVVVASHEREAIDALERMMRERVFGDAGATVVIEDTLVGQEVSYHVVSDGSRYVALAPAQDHKRAFDDDKGPNTGGMGAYSPPPVVDAALEKRILAEIVEPTLAGMASEGTPFRGVLFVGLMIANGTPTVLEYNVRFGDPECECLVTRLGGSLAELLRRSAQGELADYAPRWLAPASMAVVLASKGYPGEYERGQRIRGLAEANNVEGATVFHAGTAFEDGAYVTSGGRVLTVTAIGSTIDECAERAYRAADLIQFEGKHYRRDIGRRARA